MMTKTLRELALEREEKIIPWLKRKFPGVPFFQYDLNSLQDLPLHESFDRIVMMAVIEHLEDPRAVLEKLRPYLSPTGKLLMTTPSPLGDRIHQLGAKLNLFSQIAAAEHNIILDRVRVQRMLETTGFKLLHYKTFLLGGNQLIVASV